MEETQTFGRFFRRGRKHPDRPIGKKPFEKNPAILLFAMLICIFILVGALLIRYESERHELQEREATMIVLNSMRAALESRLYSNIHKAEGVRSLVAMNPGLTQDDFARAMEIQFRGEHDLRNIGLAKGMTMRFMYPLEGNEAAIGLDFTTVPNQFREADLARRLNTIVLAGPLTLVQGGEGVIARIPVYLADTVAYPDGFWGLASVVLDSERLFAGAGLKADYDGVRIAVRGRNALGAQGEVFWGDPLVFEQNPVTQSIELPHGSWQMGAMPSGGWQAQTVYFTTLFLGYLSAALLILGFSSFLVLFLNRMRRAERALKYERDLFTAGPVVTIEWDPAQNWSVRSVSTNVESVFGYTQSALMSSDLTLWDLIHREDLERVTGEMTDNIANHIDIFEQSYRLKTSSGEYNWVYSFNRIVRSGEGALTGVRGYMYDQSIQKHAEIQLEKERTRLDGIIKGTNVGTWEWNVQSGETVFNERWAEILGYTLAELSPASIETWEDLSNPDDLTESQALLARHFHGELDYYECESRMRHKNGEWIWVLDRGSVMTWTEDGQPLFMMGTQLDITKRKQAEEQLIEYFGELERRGLELDALYRMLNQEMESAKHIHERLLQLQLPFVERISLAAACAPATHIGGDFYQVIQKGNQMIVYVSDATGHGLDGTMFSLFVKTSIEAFVDLTPTEEMGAASILEYLNQQVRRGGFPSEYAVAIFVAVIDLDTKEMRYSAAGFQNAPVFVRDNGHLDSIPARGLPISGDIPADVVAFEEHRTVFADDALLFLATDGLYEQLDEEEVMYEDRLTALLQTCHGVSEQAVIDWVQTDFAEFRGHQDQADDTTIVALSTTPKDAFAVSSTLDALDQVRERAGQYYGERLDCENILMAVHELAANAIEHGNRADEKKAVHIEFCPNSVVVEDEGDGFDWRERVHRDLVFDLSSEERGRGIVMTQMLVGKLVYNDRGNRVSLLLSS